MAKYTKKYTRKKKRKPLTKAEKIRHGILAAVIVAGFMIAGIFCSFAYSRTGTILPTAELFDGQPTIRFVDVGQGDCTLVTYKGDSVLIDAGPVSSGEIAAEYVRMYAPVVDYFVITHPHEDHMGGAAEVLSTVFVKNLILSDITVDQEFFDNAIEAAELYGTNIIWLDDAAEFEIGKIKLEILDTFDFEYKDLNDASLVSRITVGETTLLVTGDAEKDEEYYLIENCLEKLDCDILKVGHHASRSSTTEEFLAAVSPETCVISVGRGNSYGHPTDEVLRRIESYGAEMYRTDREGNVLIRGEDPDSKGLLDAWRD